MKGKEYVRPSTPTWWLAKRSYTLLMLRESTALFVGGYAIFLLVLVYRAYQGPAPFTGLVQGLKSPVSMALHAATLIIATYHSVTWFSSIPKATVLWRGDERVNPGTLIGATWVVWILASALVAGVALAIARG